MGPIISELADLLHANKIIPFVGAGFSEGCGCPSSQTLAQQLVKRFNLAAEGLLANEDIDLLRLAEYLKITQNGDLSSVHREIRFILNKEEIDISQSYQHLLLAQLGAPIIYTTNYDRLLERSFDHLNIPYHTIISTEDVVKYADSSATQIIKFHGSLEQEDSLVLTESDYYKRLEFVTPIDIKLRADALSKSLLFLGYSFSDFNIRYLWFKLRSMTEELNAKQIPKSYILLINPDQITAALLENRGIIPIALSSCPGSTITAQLCSFLEKLLSH